jgi:hypothetical protein
MATLQGQIRVYPGTVYRSIDFTDGPGRHVTGLAFDGTGLTLYVGIYDDEEKVDALDALIRALVGLRDAATARIVDATTPEAVSA